MKNLVAKNNTIQKLNHARYFSIKKIPGPTNVCSTQERRSRSRTKKLVKIKKLKNQRLLHLTKKMLIDSVMNLPHPENVHITTRNAISSNMGKIFDPIGLLTPVTLQCKILFQMTWEREIGWDDDVGATITDQFKAWMIGLHHLSELRIPRFVANFAIEKIQLHLFCDASEKSVRSCYICPITGSISNQVYLAMF